MLKSALYFRVEDLVASVEGAQQELDNLTEMTSVINTKQQETVFKKIQKNCSLLVDASAAEERAGASLEAKEGWSATEGGFAHAVDLVPGGVRAGLARAGAVHAI